MDKIISILFLSYFVNIYGQEVDPWETRCHVCKLTVNEMENEVQKIDPSKTENVGSFRLDSEGNIVNRKVQFVKSEMFFVDLVSSVCEKMDDYVKVIHKKTGQLMVIKLLVNGKMNPITSEVHFVQDGDLNKSLKFYCEEILGEHDETFSNAFRSEVLEDDLEYKICTEKAKYCKDQPNPAEYQLEDDSEFRDEL